MSTVIVERLEQDETTEAGWVWVPTAVELNVVGDFSIEEMELSREICRMGLLLVKYGGLAAELGAELKRKEEELKLVRAQCAGAIRSHILRASAVQVDHYWRSASTKADLLNALAFRQNAEIKKSGY